MKNITSTLGLLLAVVTLSNCSPQGFSTANSLASNGGGGNSGLTGPGGSVLPITNPIANLDLQGKVDSSTNSPFGNALAFDFDKVRGEFIIMVPMPSGVFFSPSGAFSKYPDITFSPIIDAEGRMKFAVRIPVKYIIKGTQFLPPTTLPNGDKLPMMPQGYGELPSLALSFPQQNDMKISLYIGVNAIGLFVTLPTNAALPFGFTLPVRNKDKTKTFGYLTYVPAKAAFAPGLFVSTIIPASVSKILEDYFKL